MLQDFLPFIYVGLACAIVSGSIVFGVFRALYKRDVDSIIKREIIEHDR